SEPVIRRKQEAGSGNQAFLKVAENVPGDGRIALGRIVCVQRIDSRGWWRLRFVPPRSRAHIPAPPPRSRRRRSRSRPPTCACSSRPCVPPLPTSRDSQGIGL